MACRVSTGNRRAFRRNREEILGSDGGQYFGTSKIPVAVPTPFPTCPPLCPTTSPTFDAKTREYNFLFGPQFSRRKSEHWVPFGELLLGHAGVRGQAIAQGFGYNAV